MEITLPLQEVLQQLGMGKGVVAAGRNLLTGYQNGEASVIQNETDALAYASYRMPATILAVRSALDRVAQVAPWLVPQTMVDIGAGTGAGVLAAASVFETLTSAVMIEQNRYMMALGKQLLEEMNGALFADWQTSNMCKAQLPQADLLIAAYSLIELTKEDAAKMIGKMWASAHMGIVLVEPGTPEGFLRIEAYKRVLRSLGAHMLAPCVGMTPCPLLQQDDFCHFSVRVQRSRVMMQIKDGARSFEDEKYIFIAAGKKPSVRAEDAVRIVRRIEKGGGALGTRVCGADGVRDVVLRKKQPGYKSLRHSQYGDLIEI